MLQALFVFVFSVNTIMARVYDYQPQQIHLAFGESSSDIVVTWSTMDATNESIVEYGVDSMVLMARGNSRKFIDGGNTKHSQFIHSVTLERLTPGSAYTYHCGSRHGWSPKYTFRASSRKDDWSPHLAIFGDMGNENAQSLTRLQEEGQRGMYDAVIHVGDFAYDMNSANGAVGDQYMRQIEPLAAYVPYMVCAGNHEEAYNFSNYRYRFNMPGGSESLMYSFNLGPVHFIGFSTELYYFLNYGIKPLVKQFEWLEKDLTEANKPENRKQRPWIVTFGHRPMYCSNSNGNDCTDIDDVLRVGLPLTHFFGLEDLFYNHKVDVEIWAHEHSYERFLPLYNYKVMNGSMEQPYVNPKGPVHIVTGSAGCKEGREPFSRVKPKWSAYRSRDYGYTRMKAMNHTHIYFEQVSDDKNGSIIDSVWISKNV